MPILTVDTFLDTFSEFANSDFTAIEQLLNQIVIDTDGYCGLNTEAKQNYALSLHLAHLASIRAKEDKFKDCSGGLALKKIESENDILEFHNTADRFGFGNSEYGVRLEAFLERQYCGGFFIAL